MPDYRKWVFSPRDRFQWHAWLKISNFEHYSLATWSKLWDLAILRFWNYFPIIRPTITAWKCPYSGLFWSVFSRIRTEYGKIRTRITPNTGTFHAVYWCLKRTQLIVFKHFGFCEERLSHASELFHHLLFEGADICIYVVVFMDFLNFCGQLIFLSFSILNNFWLSMWWSLAVGCSLFLGCWVCFESVKHLQFPMSFNLTEWFFFKACKISSSISFVIFLSS